MHTRKYHPLTIRLGRVAVIGLVVWTGALAATPTAAANRRGVSAGPVQRPPRGEVDRRGNELDRQVADAMQDLLVARLAKHLELTKAQETTVIPMIREVTRMRRDHAISRREAIRALAMMSRDANADDDVIGARLSEFQSDEASFRDQVDTAMGEIRAELDVRQQARLLSIYDGFRDEMRRRVEDVRQQRGGPMRPRYPSADRRPGPGGRPPGERFR